MTKPINKAIKKKHFNVLRLPAHPFLRLFIASLDSFGCELFPESNNHAKILYLQPASCEKGETKRKTVSTRSKSLTLTMGSVGH